MIIASENGCKICGLYRNQLPLVDDNCSVSDVLWLGLSAKQIKDSAEAAPLGTDTNTGKIIHRIEHDLNKYVFAKTNLVKCAPLDQDKRLRYPTYGEMSSCYCHLASEIVDLSPQLVFLLGLRVAKFVLGEKDIRISGLDNEFDYGFYECNNIIFIPIHHPSFIHIYKRKQLDLYVSKVQGIISQTLDTQGENTSGKAS